MKYLAALLFSGLALAQTPPPASQPDCTPIALTIAGGNGIAPQIPTPYLDNRTLGCVTFLVQYEADSTLSGYTVAFQSATGSAIPGTFGAYTGTTVASSASFGTAQFGLATFSNLVSTAGDSVETPFLRVSISGATGTGNIRVMFYGYRTWATGGTGGGGGGGFACNATPCNVQGTGTAGSPLGGVLTIQGPGTAGAALPVIQNGGPTFTSGQTAVTGTAANLGTAAALSVCVHALITNTINVYAGATGVTTSTGMELPPGSGWCWNVTNTNLIFVVASTAGASVSYTVTD
jgi:hypothetical protein